MNVEDEAIIGWQKNELYGHSHYHRSSRFLWTYIINVKPRWGAITPLMHPDLFYDTYAGLPINGIDFLIINRMPIKISLKYHLYWHG